MVEMNEELSELFELAVKAKENAYVPYSHFHVGAALLTKSGKIYTGCNIENSSFGATNCAERTAMFKAVSEGDREFKAIAIASDHEITEPCGICRQVMSEFDDGSMTVVIGKDTAYSLNELLPLMFELD